jgi:hypothetical protein
MRAPILFAAAVLLSWATNGCNYPSPSAPTAEQATPAATAIDPVDAMVADLFTQYKRLPDDKKDTLAGDKLIIQIEAMLSGISGEMRRKVEKTVEVHNRKLLKRAIEDTSADPEPEVTGIEFPPPPRETKKE